VYTVHLLKSFRMPALLYAVEVLRTKTDIATLIHLVDRAVYRIFSSTSTEDAQFLRCILDFSSVNSCLNDRLATFLSSFSRSFSWAAMGTRARWLRQK